MALTFPHDIVFTPDILRSFPDLVVASESKGVNFKTNATLFAIFCPVFKELLTECPENLDQENMTVIIDCLCARDIHFLDQFLHEGSIVLEVDDTEEVCRIQETFSFLFGSSDFLRSVEVKTDLLVESVKTEELPDTNEQGFQDESQEHQEAENEMESSPGLDKKIINATVVKSPPEIKTQKSKSDTEFDIFGRLKRNGRYVSGQDPVSDGKVNQRKKFGRHRGHFKKSLPPRRKREPGEKPTRKVKSKYQQLLEDSEKINPSTMNFRESGRYGLRGVRKVRQFSDVEVNSTESDVDEDYIVLDEQDKKDPQNDKQDFSQVNEKEERLIPIPTHGLKRKVCKEQDTVDVFCPKMQNTSSVAYDEWDKQVCEKMLVHETSDKTIATFGVLYRHSTDFESQTNVFLKSETQRNEEKWFVCPHCNEAIEDWNHYIHHVLGHDFVLSCGICPKFFEDREARFQHWIDHFRTNLTGTINDDVISCKICGKEFKTITKLRRFNAKKFSHHLSIHEATMDPCIACGFLPELQSRKFKNQKEYVENVRKGVEPRPPIAKDNLHDIFEIFLKHKKDMGPHHDSGCTHLNCDDIKFSSWREHLEHVDVHHGGCFKWKCGFCQQLFDSEIALDAHYDGQHKIIKKKNYDHICHCCGQGFGKERSLRAHIKKYHEENRGPVVCDKCGKTFANASSLYAHTYIHRKVNINVSCEQCGKVFTTENAKRSLKMHVLSVHTPEDQKPFGCNACGKRFTNLKTMRVHVAIHDNKREHQCRFCGQGFNDKRNMYAHEKKNCSKRF